MIEAKQPPSKYGSMTEQDVAELYEEMDEMGLFKHGR